MFYVTLEQSLFLGIIFFYFFQGYLLSFEWNPYFFFVYMFNALSSSVGYYKRHKIHMFLGRFLLWQAALLEMEIKVFPKIGFRMGLECFIYLSNKVYSWELFFCTFFKDICLLSFKWNSSFFFVYLFIVVSISVGYYQGHKIHVLT